MQELAASYVGYDCSGGAVSDQNSSLEVNGCLETLAVVLGEERVIISFRLFDGEELFAQALVGGLLHVFVHSGVDREAAARHGVVAYDFTSESHHLIVEVGGAATEGAGIGLYGCRRETFVFLAGRDGAFCEHTGEDVVAILLVSLGIADGIDEEGVFDTGHERGAFRDGEVLGFFPEKAQRSRSDAIVAFAEVHAVEIHLKELSLVGEAFFSADLAHIVFFDLERDKGLHDFTLDAGLASFIGFLLQVEGIARQLHGDGAGSLSGFAGLQVQFDCAQDPDPVHPIVLPEALVLLSEEGVDEDGGNLVDGDEGTVFVIGTTNEGPVAVKDLTGDFDIIDLVVIVVGERALAEFFEVKLVEEEDGEDAEEKADQQKEIDTPTFVKGLLGLAFVSLLVHGVAMQPASELSGGESYLGEGAEATVRLAEIVMAEIDAEGPISFRKFFDTVLYHPDLGYYARPQKARTGKEGDFFTAVSVGPLFGRILAEYAYLVWAQAGKPTDFRIVEWGAEQGDLAKDILAGGKEIGGEFGKALQYAVVEPLPLKRRALQEIFPEVTVVTESSELSPLPGLVLGNELIDALSFWLVRWEEGKWWEKRVGKKESGHSCPDVAGESQFQFQLAPPTPELQKRLLIIEGKFSEGYETEIRPSLAPLLTKMKSVLAGGEILLFDYGFERNDLYHPSRTTGTLRTYGRHQAAEDPLSDLGQLDITAHVDFTSLEEDGGELGLAAQPLESQGHFLTKAAASLLTKMDGQVDPQFIRQFQTLTHPAHLGTKFSVFRAKG